MISNDLILDFKFRYVILQSRTLSSYPFIWFNSHPCRGRDVDEYGQVLTLTLPPAFKNHGKH